VRLLFGSISILGLAACTTHATETRVIAVRPAPATVATDAPELTPPALLVPKQKENAEARAACEAGDAETCNVLAVWLEKHGGTDAESYALYERACARDLAVACSNQGVYLANGYAVPIDTARAAALYRKACDGHYAKGCVNLADATASGAGVTKNLALAKKLRESACDLGSGEGCADLAYGLEHESKPNLDAAVKAYDRGCRLGSALACHNLGVMFADGRGVVASPKRTDELYARSCELGDKEDCK
jgi:TPR repeat protein